MAVTKVDQTNFKTEVLDSKKTVILDFWAEWCGPCKMISPLVDELSDELTDIHFCKINVDDEPALAGAFGIVSIPTLIKIKDGKSVDQSVGYAGKESLRAWIKK